MMKLFCYLIISTLFLPLIANASEQRIMAKYSFSKNNSGFSLELSSYQDDFEFENYKKNKELKISFDKNLVTQYQEQIKSYSGYRNVEGFENNKRRDDITFASLITGAGLLVIVAGAVTIVAVASAL